MDNVEQLCIDHAHLPPAVARRVASAIAGHHFVSAVATVCGYDWRLNVPPPPPEEEASNSRTVTRQDRSL